MNNLSAKYKIINPEIFLYCGYKYNYTMLRSRMLDDKSLMKKINDVYDALSLNHTDFIFGDDIIFDAIIKQKIKELCKTKQKREIFTKYIPELKGKVLDLYYIKRVQTGIYNPRETYIHQYYGCEEYIDPYISNRKYHDIYVLADLKDQKIASTIAIQIEDIHIEKVE